MAPPNYDGAPQQSGYPQQSGAPYPQQGGYAPYPPQQGVVNAGYAQPYPQQQPGYVYNAPMGAVTGELEDDNHFINKFLSQCPCGRYQTVKYTGAWDRGSFFYATLYIL